MDFAPVENPCQTSRTSPCDCERSNSAPLARTLRKSVRRRQGRRRTRIAPVRPRRARSGPLRRCDRASDALPLSRRGGGHRPHRSRVDGAVFTVDGAVFTVYVSPVDSMAVDFHPRRVAAHRSGSRGRGPGPLGLGEPVAALLAEGRSLREIPGLTGGEERAIRRHLRNAFESRGISGQMELVHQALSVAESPERPRRDRQSKLE